MNDLFHIGSTDPLTTQTFIGGSGSAAPTATSFRHVWYKPRGASIVSIVLVGAGAGGGSGESGTAGTQRGGGGGGGSGAVVTASFPAFLLPDILYIITPDGGEPGGIGARAYVAVDVTSLAAAGLLLVSGTADAAAGGNGSGGSGGALGGFSTAPSKPLALFTSYAFGWNGSNGNNGSAGNSGGAAAVLAWVGPRHGGIGGSGCVSADTAAGGYSTGTPSPIPQGAGATAAGEGVAGSLATLGPTILLGSCGGTGGGASNAGTGGKGGDGGPGSGGGGGGAGVTGGVGGRGGPAICAITAF